ncbi:MAG: hypothetical protein J6U20_03690 [Fibrobacter sp.]|nr:hypothetical protein [Fibrobacter sp.]
MNIAKVKDYVNEIIELLFYPLIIIEKAEKNANHQRQFAKKKATTLKPKIRVYNAMKFNAMLAPKNGNTPTKPTVRQPDIFNSKRPNLHIGVISADKFQDMKAKKNGNTPTKQAISRTEQFIH